jgi:hypothetical protein
MSEDTTGRRTLDDLEAEIAQLKEELAARQARIWAISTALQCKPNSSDAAQFDFASKLEAYLLGSHAEAVEKLTYPLKTAVA